MPGDSLTILHLSDPQFGKNHVFGKRALPIKDGQHDTLLSRTCEDLDLLNKTWGLQPDIVVLTGDVAEWGKREEFAQGFGFLEGVSRHLGIQPQQRNRVAVIPGNHDINRNHAEAEYNEWLANDKEGDPFGFRRWKFFAEAFKTFYADVPDTPRPIPGGAGSVSLRPSFTEEQPHSVFIVPEHKVVLAGMNSNFMECHLDAKSAKKLLGKDTFYGHHGWCGEDQYRYFQKLLTGWVEAGWFRLGLVHHNIVRGSTTDDENLLDAPMLKDRLGGVLNLLLHGHTHIADRSLLTHGQPVLATGSNALGQAQRPDETPNQYQVLRVNADGVMAWMRAYNHHSRRWIPDARVGGEETPGRLWIPHAFLDAAATFPKGPSGHTPDEASRVVSPRAPSPHSAFKASPKTDDEPETAHSQIKGLRSIANQFTTITQLRWPGCHTSWHETEPPYLIVVTDEDYGNRSFAVGLVTGSCRDEDVNAFDDLTSSFNWERWLVCHRPDAANWPSLKEAAESRGIRLLSWRDYERMCDLRIAVERQKSELNDSKDYPPNLYISQGMEFFPALRPGESANEAKADRVTMDGRTEMLALIRAGGPAFFLIDGDFGAGKTFLLRQLALEFSVAGSPVIPLLIELRSLEKVQDASSMLITRLGKLGQPEIRPAQLAFMAEEGHLLILFDGYDELALRVSFDRAADHLNTIIAAAKGRAIVVLTCRTQHFKDDHQMVVSLLDQPGMNRARLLPFTQPQIQAFLEKKLGCPIQAAERFQLIQDITDLLGLSENPRMLSFIADLPAEDLTAAREAAPNATITAAGLYEIILHRWLTNEVRRRSHQQNRDATEGKGTRSTAQSDQRYLMELWESVTRLAFLAWGRTERPFSLDEIKEELAKVSVNLLDVTLEPPERMHGITSGSLLSREGPGLFAFAHYSIIEYLVAREIARQRFPESIAMPVMHEAQASASLGKEVLSDLMAEFLVDELGALECADWVLEIFKTEPGHQGEHGRRNAERLATTARRRIEDRIAKAEVPTLIAGLEGSNMANSDLRGRSYAAYNLSACNFKASNLSQATFRCSKLTYSNFENAILVSADLTSTDLRQANLKFADLRAANLTTADLRGADLTGVNLSRATLIGADLRGAILTDSQWDLARLAGARLDEGALSGLSAFGTVLPSISFSPSFLPGASWVNCVAYSNQHDFIATGHANGCICLWDAVSRRCTLTLPGHQNSIKSVAISPDGSLLVSGSSDNTLRLWNAINGEHILEFSGHQDWVRCVAFSPDGQLIASGSDDNTLRLWDPKSGKQLHELQEHQNYVTCVAFSPDGQLIASGSDDNTLRLWNPKSGKQLLQFKDVRRSVASIDFNHEGSRIASGSDDNTLCLWDATSGKLLLQFHGHQRWLRSVAFSPDGSRIGSGSDDNTLRLWDATNGKQLIEFSGHQDSVNSVAFNHDGSRIASGSSDNTLRLWNTTDGTQLFQASGHQTYVNSVAFSPNGAQIASGSSDHTLRIWDASNGKRILGLKGHRDWVRSIAFNFNGSRLISGSDDKTLRLWDTTKGKQLLELKGHQHFVLSVAFSPDGSRIASGSADHTLGLWDASTGKRILELRGHQNFVNCVAFNSDGSRLISCSSDNTMRLWDTARGLALLKIKGHQKSVLSVAFSPSGLHFASGSDDNSLRLWSTANGRHRMEFKGHQHFVLCVAFSPDGLRIASGSSDKTLRIWNTSNGKALLTLEGHNGAVNSVAFLPRRLGESLLLISSSDDGTIRLWDADKGDCLGILMAHGEGWAALRPDGRYRAEGDMRQFLWHVSGLCRYELGELDGVEPGLRLGDDEPLIEGRYFGRT